MSAAVYSSACTAPIRAGDSCPIHVMNVLATVARNSHTLFRQASRVARGWAAEIGRTPSSGEGITGGSGEPLESGCELGIDSSYIGLQLKFTPRKAFIFANV